MRTEPTFYRRRPGIGWLVALVVVPLLLALIGWGAAGRSTDRTVLTQPSVAPSATLTIASAPPAPTSPPVGSTAPEGGAKYGAMSIVRSANGFTITGEVPDDSFKGLLPQALRQAMPGAVIVDDLVVRPGVSVPEIAGLGGLFGVALGTPGFSAKLVGDTVTLGGRVPTPDLKADAESSARVAWPNVKVVNDITVAAASVSATPPAPMPQAPAPGPTSAGGCATLQSDLSGLLRTPINFAIGGFALAPDSQRLLSQIAAKVKPCPNARLAVVGYTDNSGNDGINVPLSASRAKSVADGLVAGGVKPTDVTSSGAGSANPLADNDTPQGRAQNRRVEITVS